MNSTIMERYLRGRKDVWVLLGMLFAAMPLAAATARIYVTNRAGTTIDVIDPATNKVVERDRRLESPEVVRFSPDGSRIYIANQERGRPLRYGSKERKVYQKGAAQRLGQRCSSD